MTASVTVSVPARLHLGFLDLNGGLGRRFGSIGLAISGLRTCVSIRRASQMRVRGPERDRALHYVETMQRVIDPDTAYDVQVDEVVPSHAGLGSGTQLALAIAAGIRRLYGLPLDIGGDACRLGRGERSGVGIGLFGRGGLVVDGGRGSAAGPAPIISHMPFPEGWRVLVVLDPRRQGVHGADERAAFARLPPASEAETAHLCRLVVMRILPAVAEGDLPTFGAAIKEMQARIGDHFAPVQGGRRFASDDVADALNLLEREGAVGIGQSSWGPTGYAFVPSSKSANDILDCARRHPGCRGVDIRICRGLNGGAAMTVQAPIVATPGS
jgi:beta-RFAP synthase